MSSPCDSKRYYDTEFEAELGAAQTSYKYGAEMVPYRCGRHWHIANKNPELRSRKRTFNQTYCKYCDCYMKRGRYDAHLKKRRHQLLARKEKEAD